MSNKLPDWLEQLAREQQRKLGVRKQWGGKRVGAGRKKQYDYLTIRVRLNRIMRLNLEELGDGDVQVGVQRLIEKHV